MYRNTADSVVLSIIESLPYESNCEHKIMLMHLTCFHMEKTQKPNFGNSISCERPPPKIETYIMMLQIQVYLITSKQARLVLRFEAA